MADAVVDEEPFERFATSGTEQDHGLVNAVENAFALLWCSSLAPAAPLLSLLNFGHETQGELRYLPLCFVASSRSNRLPLMKERPRPLRDWHKARGRSLHLNESRECFQMRPKALGDLSRRIVFQ